MYKFVLFLSLLVLVSSCRKGDQDPFLSLKSRKARLAGEYKVETWEYQSFANGSLQSNKDRGGDLMNGEHMEITNYEDVSDEPDTVFYNITKATYDIGKDGTWMSHIELTKKWSGWEGYPFPTYGDFTEHTVEVQSGMWSFMGGQQEDFKNKERVLFDLTKSVLETEASRVEDWDGTDVDIQENPKKEVFTYSPGQMSIVYEIVMLKSNEILLKQDLTEESSRFHPSLTVTKIVTGSSELKLVAK